jgi:hypothetical protein
METRSQYTVICCAGRRRCAATASVVPGTPSAERSHLVALQRAKISADDPPSTW